MYSEYSVAYSYETKQDLDKFTNDFNSYLRELFDDEKYQYGIKQIPIFLFDLLEVSDLKDTKTLPEKFKILLEKLILNLENKTISHFDVHNEYATAGDHGSYEASHLQALYFLIAYYNDTKDKKIEILPQKFKAFISNSLEKRPLFREV